MEDVNLPDSFFILSLLSAISSQFNFNTLHGWPMVTGALHLRDLGVCFEEAFLGSGDTQALDRLSIRIE